MASSPVVEVISRRRPGQATLSSIFWMMASGSVMSVPPQPMPGLGDLEVAPRRRLAPAHADAGRLHVQHAAGLVLGQHAGDVVVDHDHLVDMAQPLLGEDADGGRAAADPHAHLGLAIDDRRLAGRHDHGVAAVDAHFHGRPGAQVEQRVAGDVAFLLGAAGQVPHAADGQHLRAVLGRGDVADLLALDADRRRLRGRDAGRCRSSP